MRRRKVQLSSVQAVKAHTARTRYYMPANATRKQVADKLRSQRKNPKANVRARVHSQRVNP